MRFGPVLVIALLLLILWAGGFLMFHVAGDLIHLLLLFASPNTSAIMSSVPASHPRSTRRARCCSSCSLIQSATT